MNNLLPPVNQPGPTYTMQEFLNGLSRMVKDENSRPWNFSILETETEPENHTPIELVSGEVPKEMLLGADQDSELAGVVEPQSAKHRLVIMVNGEAVGFLTPRQDGKFWRTGAIYVAPQHQGQGIGKLAVQAFFADGRPGLATISETNRKSQGIFRAAGFQPTEKFLQDGEEILRVWVKS